MKLRAPEGLAVRPTADRVKEALFNILGSRTIGSRFIDLYAGSGAIGIEALSRGAESCIFVDNRPANKLLIDENLSKTGLESAARVILSDVDKALITLRDEETRADIIYLDPPYNYSGLDVVAGRLFEYNLIADSGVVVAEHAYSNREWLDRFKETRIKKYGDTALSFIYMP